MEQKLTNIRAIKNLLGHCAHGWHFSSTTHFPHPELEEIRAILANKHGQQLHCVLGWSVLPDFYVTMSVSIGRKEKDKAETVSSHPSKAVSVSQTPVGGRAGEGEGLVICTSRKFLGMLLDPV